MVLVAVITVGGLVGDILAWRISRLWVDRSGVRLRVIASAEPVVGDSEEFIVQKTMVDGEEAHHEPEVTSHGEALHAWVLLELLVEEAKHDS